MHASPINLPPDNFSISSSNDSDYGIVVAVEGTWVIKNEKQAFPLQTSTITCSKENYSCTGVTAMVMYGKQLIPFIDTFKILKWDNSHILIVDDSPVCVDYTYTLDLINKKVTGVRTRKSDVASCAGFNETLHMKLTNGFDSQLNYEKEKEKSWLESMKTILLYLRYV